MHHEQRFVLRQLDDADLRLARDRERAFAAGKNAGQIERSGLAGVTGAVSVAVGNEFVKVVAADAPENPGKTGQDFRPKRLAQPGQLAVEPAGQIVAARQAGEPGRIHRTEEGFRSVGENGLDLQHMVDHLAVDDRVRPRRIIPDHAAERGPAARGSVGTELKSLRLQIVVELVLNDPRLDPHPALLDIEFQHLVHVLGEIDVHGVADGLSGKTRGAASGQDGRLVADRDTDRGRDIIGVPGNHYADRLDLPNAGVGAIEDLRVCVETNLSLHFPAKLLGEVCGIGRHGEPDLPLVRGLVFSGNFLWESSLGIACPAPRWRLATGNCPAARRQTEHRPVDTPGTTPAPGVPMSWRLPGGLGNQPAQPA